MSKSQSKIPSPARSQGPITPRRSKPRRTLSTASPARSDASVRLSSVVEKFIKNDKFTMSPMKRRSVLPDDTEIEAPRRASWWKRLEGSSRDVLEALDTNKMTEDKQDIMVEEYEFEIEKSKEKTVSESSDNESVASIVVPQRRLFNQKKQSQGKFGDIIGSRKSLGKTNIEDISIDDAPKNLFNKGPRNRPIFPAALLNSTNKTINKTVEPEPSKPNRPNLFGQAGTKRKNMFTDFVLSESEEDSEVQPSTVFGFKKYDNKRISLGTRNRRKPSLTPSMTTEIDIDDWNLLPSSTMIGAPEVSRVVTDEDIDQVANENLDDTLTDKNTSLEPGAANKTNTSVRGSDENDKTLTNENIDAGTPEVSRNVTDEDMDQEPNEPDSIAKKNTSVKSDAANKMSDKNDRSLANENASAPEVSRIITDDNMDEVPDKHQDGISTEVNGPLKPDAFNKTKNKSIRASDESDKTNKKINSSSPEVLQEIRDEDMDQVPNENQVTTKEISFKPDEVNITKHTSKRDSGKKDKTLVNENIEKSEVSEIIIDEDMVQVPDENLVTTKEISFKPDEVDITKHTSKRESGKKDRTLENENIETSEVSEIIIDEDMDQVPDENQDNTSAKPNASLNPDAVNKTKLMSLKSGVNNRTLTNEQNENPEVSLIITDDDMDHEPDEEIDDTLTEETSLMSDAVNKTKHKTIKESRIESPEAVLQNMTKDNESFRPMGRSTSFRKSKSVIENINIRPSLATVQESTLGSDGSKTSSTEGSGWDSHRTTRKTIRQTFGKDFTPRKSLRALVMEQSAKRQTELYNRNASELNKSKNKTKNKSVLENTEKNASKMSKSKNRTTIGNLNDEKSSKMNTRKNKTMLDDIDNHLIRDRRISNLNTSSDQVLHSKSPAHGTSAHHVSDPLISEPQISYHKSVHELNEPEMSDQQISRSEESIDISMEANDSGPEISIHASYGQSMSRESSDHNEQEKTLGHKISHEIKDVSRRDTSIRLKSSHVTDQEVLDYEASDHEKSEQEIEQAEVRDSDNEDLRYEDSIQGKEEENSEPGESENEIESEHESEVEHDEESQQENEPESEGEIENGPESEHEESEQEESLQEMEVESEQEEIHQEAEVVSEQEESQEVEAESEQEIEDESEQEESQQEIEAESVLDESQQETEAESEQDESQQEIEAESEQDESQQEIEAESEHEEPERDEETSQENAQSDEENARDISEGPDNEMLSDQENNQDDSDLLSGLNSNSKYQMSNSNRTERVVFDNEISEQAIDYELSERASRQEVTVLPDDISEQVSERDGTPEITGSRVSELSKVHDVSIGTKKSMLIMQMEKIAQQNMEMRQKIREKVQSSLKLSRNFNKMSPIQSKFPIRRINKTEPKKPKPKPKNIPIEALPKDFVEDLMYKPPKRFQPSSAPWITKRLYKFLETKLEPKYDYRARVRAEELVQTIHSFTKLVRRRDVAPQNAVDELKREMARLHIVDTHFEFYDFFHEFMPREIRIKVNPDVVNRIPMPRNGVFSNILPGRVAVE